MTQRFKQLFAMALTVALAGAAAAQVPPDEHPDTSGPEWTDLFAPDLSNAIAPAGVWSVEEGELTASEDQNIWTEQEYDNFVLDLEYRTGPGTNSGVIIYASDIQNWIPNSVEIQIADDHHEQWASSPATWQNAAIFGRLAPARSNVNPPGEWNRMTVTAVDRNLWVMVNGEMVTEMDMSKWTSATTNPDGSEIPRWLSRPLAEIPTHGHIGFQGKHGGAPIWFRNVRIRVLD
jgi:hypothetical protein